jgi:hypothetical protein
MVRAGSHRRPRQSRSSSRRGRRQRPRDFAVRLGLQGRWLGTRRWCRGGSSARTRRPDQVLLAEPTRRSGPCSAACLAQLLRCGGRDGLGELFVTHSTEGTAHDCSVEAQGPSPRRRKAAERHESSRDRADCQGRAPGRLRPERVALRRFAADNFQAMRRPSTGFLAALVPILLVLAVYGSLSYGGCEDYGSTCIPALSWVGMLAWVSVAGVAIELLRRLRRH